MLSRSPYIDYSVSSSFSTFPSLSAAPFEQVKVMKTRQDALWHKLPRGVDQKRPSERMPHLPQSISCLEREYIYQQAPSLLISTELKVNPDQRGLDLEGLIGSINSALPF